MDIELETLNLKVTKPIHIVPVTSGAKSSKQKGTGKTIAGIAMIAAGVITANPQLITTGLTMTLRGATALLAPKVGKDISAETFIFNGTPESISEGSPVPLVYGEYVANTVPVSFTIETIR